LAGKRRGKEGEPQLNPQRLTRILEGAQTVFLAHGFKGATTDMIQAAAGVSKATLYRYFQNKEDLFKAAMEVRSRQFLQDVAPLYAEAEDVGVFLAEFGKELLVTLLGQRSLEVVRLMMMESQRFPKLGKHFYLAGPKLGADVVERYLADAHLRGQVCVDNPALAAEHFISMIRGEIHFRALLGAAKPPTVEQMHRYVAATVAAFLRAYAPVPRDE
jgi:AcrR family transcriptional regulator